MHVEVLGCSSGISGDLRTTCFMVDHDIKFDAPFDEQDDLAILKEQERLISNIKPPQTLCFDPIMLPMPWRWRAIFHVTKISCCFNCVKPCKESARYVRRLCADFNS